MFSYIILHYKNLPDTIACIASIRKVDPSSKIVVVDNATLTNEEKKLIEKKVDALLVMSQNIGFAKANNKGCQYAYENFQTEFYVVLNNDTLILQDDFCEKVSKLYKRISFDILGPKILCKKESGSVNPYRPLKTVVEVEKEIKYQKKLIPFYKSRVLYFLLQNYLKLKQHFFSPIYLENGKLEEQNVAVHGCAIIFSKKYVKKFPNVFYPNTFLFHEEDFLYYRIKKEKLLSLYSPEIEIVHKEGGSLEKMFKKNKRKKLLFRTEEIIKSLLLLKNEMTKE